ncbi:hypothetical protein ABZP36_015941 [Zizania latifolia]
MAPEAKQLAVRLRENEALAQCVLEKWRSMEEKTGGLGDNLAHRLANSYRNVCAAKDSRSPSEPSRICIRSSNIPMHIRFFPLLR